MINNKPVKGRTNSGNYIPKNIDKVYKTNSEGGLYYRSSWELKIMIWLDNNPDIVLWGAECVEIPYSMERMVNGIPKTKNHRYFPDFYYKIKNRDGSIVEILAEVKPHKEYLNTILFKEEKLKVKPNATMKQLRNFEYDLKTARTNLHKWDTLINYANKKGIKFIIITEKNLDMFSV